MTSPIYSPSPVLTIATQLRITHPWYMYLQHMTQASMNESHSSEFLMT